MRQILSIARAELSILFFSPIAWLIIIIFSFQSYSVFAGVIENLVNRQFIQGLAPNATVEIFSKWRSIYPAVQKNLHLYVPLLTMGLMSREYSSGSIKLLYSSPLTSFQVVFGKFLSVLGFSLILMGTLIPVIVFTYLKVESADLAYMISGWLGLTLLMFAYAAIGLFMSTLTSYQVVAAMLTLGTLALLGSVGSIGQGVSFIRDITYWLSLTGRADRFVNGFITSEHIMYFIIVIFIFLAFSIIKLQAGKTQQKLPLLIAKHLGIVLVAVLLGMVSSHPRMIAYYDASQVKANTLSEGTQQILGQLDGKLRVTTYVNMADNQFHLAMPTQINTDKARFNQYVRFIPRLKMDYTYYYDEPYKNRNYNPKTTSAVDLARTYGTPYKVNFDKMLSPMQIRSQIDLAPESNTFVRVLEAENGRKTFLRVFDDMQKHPNETEISGAIKRLLMDAPRVAFLEGYGGPSIHRKGDRDYLEFTTNRFNRTSLMNMGFDVDTLYIREEQPLSELTDILVIADPRAPLSESTSQKVLEFIEDGGNLILAVEPGREHHMKEITRELGVHFLPGILVRPDQDFTPTLIPSNISHLSVNLSHLFRSLFRTKIVMPGAVGLDFSLNHKFEAIPLTITERRGFWNEMETKDFENEKPVLNRRIGERERIIPTSLALRRMVGEKEQRIIVLGDADCISNGELATKRADIDAGNASFIRAMFHWLSYEEFPVDVRRPSPPDNRLLIEHHKSKHYKAGLTWIVPALLTMLGSFVVMRRKRR